MTSLYRNTISLAYLLLCLFITSSSTRSFIRQSTEEFNTTLQQEVGAIQNLDVAEYLHESQEISSRDYKVSASNAVKGLRDRPPSSYSLKMSSFSTLLTSIVQDRYESRPFAVGGYNWKLVVFPKGNRKEGGSGYISLYLAIDDSTPIAAGKEVFVDIRFYIFNKIENKYFTIQDTDVWHFDAISKMWGFPQVLSLDTFKDPKNGYLYDVDNCEFGVDVTIPSLYKLSELFSVTVVFPNPIFTWDIPRFSTLHNVNYQSDTFSIGGRNWFIKVYPNGVASATGKFLSMYLNLGNGILKPYEKIYVRAKLRVLNQYQHPNVERLIDNWYTSPGSGWGYIAFISLDDLKDPAKGFVVNDVLKVQVEMEAISFTQYFPS